MNEQLIQSISQQTEFAREEVNEEWRMKELSEHGNHFIAIETATTTRLLAMALTRLDSVEQNSHRNMSLLRAIGGILIFIAAILAFIAAK